VLDSEDGHYQEDSNLAGINDGNQYRTLPVLDLRCNRDGNLDILMADGDHDITRPGRDSSIGENWPGYLAT
jgi:hypothetical protein